MTAPLPHNEAQRLSALRAYGILDTPLEPAFEDITRLAAYICEAPIAVINLIDEGRQWFKSEIGLGVRETPLDISICAHAILQPGLFVVPDTTQDERFACNPLVTGEPHLRFYAGALLQTPDGFPLGTMCVLDYKARRLRPEQAAALTALARQTMAQFELRRALAQADRVSRERSRVMAIAGHDLKQPLQVISVALDAVQPHLPNPRQAKLVETALDAADRLARELDGLATASRLGKAAPELQPVALDPLLRDVVSGWRSHAERKAQSVQVVGTRLTVGTDPRMLRTILGNLIGNAIKYTPEGGRILVGCRRRGACVSLEVWDTGLGIAPENLERVFHAFQQVDPKQAEGLGMGLAIVRETASTLGVTVGVRSRLGRGSVFAVEVPLADADAPDAAIQDAA